MDKLKAQQLYGGGLVPISGSLVDRYNQCLHCIGKLPTALTSFAIDGIGWSPEIAKEKENIYYLNNGEANPSAIIISPKQQNTPIYFPFHSFDKAMMALVFENYEAQIKDITKDGGICVDLDQYIDAFYEPLDLLKYNTISIGFKLTNDLEQVQKEQFKLIELFHEGNNCIDEEVHLKLLASSRKYGDLRTRQLELSSLNYITTSFYTKAFGGVFVINTFTKPILIFETKTSFDKAKKGRGTQEILLYHINNEKLIAQLVAHRVIRHHLLRTVHTERYHRIKNVMLLAQVKEIQHEVKEIINNPILYKYYLNSINSNKTRIVTAVERFVEKKRKAQQTEWQEYIDPHFFGALCQPATIYSGEQEDLIWKLITRISRKDPLYMYWYDKEQFYEQYQTWSASFQEWVVECITKEHQKIDK